MPSYKEIHASLDYFAENIAKEISEKRYYEIEEIKAKAKTRLWFAITDCLSITINDSEEKKRKLVSEYQNCNDSRKIHIGIEISKLNSKIKDANKVIMLQRDYEEYEMLKKYVKDNYGNEVMQSFFEMCKQVKNA